MRLSPIASTLWESWPGRITVMTLATPSSVGLATESMAFLTLFCTLGSSVVLIRYPLRAISCLLIPARARYWST